MYRELKFALAAGADSSLAGPVFRDRATLTDSDDAASVSHPEYDLTDGATDELVDLGTVATPRFFYMRNLDDAKDITYKLRATGETAKTLEHGGVIVMWNTVHAEGTALYLSNASGADVKLAIYASGDP